MSTLTLAPVSAGEGGPRVPASLPAPAPVHRTVARQAAVHPSRTAVRAHDGVLTYGGLDQRANHLAHRLRAHGVRDRDTVAVCLEPSARLLVAVLGVLKAGAGYVLLDPAHVRSGSALPLLYASGAGVVVTQELFAGVLGGGRVTVLPDVTPASSTAVLPPASDVTHADTAYVLPVRGDRGVSVPHTVIGRLAADGRFLPVTAGDVVLQYAPAVADGTALALWAPLMAGARLVLPPPGELTPYELATLAREERAGILRVTSRHLSDLIDAGVLPGLRGLRCLVVAGDALPPEAAARVAGLLPATRVIETARL
ncbi:AMP-binding protein [Streptomyces roseoverticillatus]|uniref:AMP-binding protein n=1 Tax=Streptomyces roseoverticillatus TaxID=66429 RepID=UPI000693A879|nr:AMP-binding protein [Streptomyces roseoverticillatus]